MNIIIVDDNATFRNGLKFYLEEILCYKVIAIAENGYEFLSLSHVNEVDIVLLDNSLPMITGVEISKNYLSQYPDIKIIMVTQQPEILTVKQIVESGLRGCVDKKDVVNQLDKAIKKVFEGKTYFSDGLLIE